VTEEFHTSFLDRVASPAPTPAGGAAAALAGALSAALVAMACRVTARRDPSSAELEQVEEEAEALRARLTALVQEDGDAYTAVIQARRAADAERPQAVSRALVRATEIPVEIARGASRVLALCDRLVPAARASTVSDLGVAVSLAAGALEGATLTARVNVRDLDDPALASQTRAALAALVEEASVVRHRVTEIIAARTGVPA